MFTNSQNIAKVKTVNILAFPSIVWDSLASTQQLPKECSDEVILG